MANDSNQRKADMAEAKQFRGSLPRKRYDREQLRKYQLRQKEAELWPAQRELLTKVWR